MAWHPGKPVNSDFIEDSIQHIRENFEAMDSARIIDHNLGVASPPNGYYVRYQSGLQIVQHALSITMDINNSQGSGTLFRSAFQVIPWPVTFAGMPSASLTCNVDASNRDVWVGAVVPGTNNVQFQLLASQSKAGLNVAVTVLAIGRWA